MTNPWTLQPASPSSSRQQRSVLRGNKVQFYEAIKVSSTRQQRSVLRGKKGQFYAALSSSAELQDKSMDSRRIHALRGNNGQVFYAEYPTSGGPHFTAVHSTQPPVFCCIFYETVKKMDKSTDIFAGVSMFYEATNVISTQHLQPSVSMFYEETKISYTQQFQPQAEL
jgi:hypothetical protein